jgi:hypothetical protein
MRYDIKEIKEFILRCYASAGQNSNSTDAAVLISLFCREVETSWKRHIRITNKGTETESWNLNEIYYFIELGLSKCFGDYFGINLITFKQFQHAYAKNENTHYRKEYLLKNPLPQLVAVEQHTKSGKDEIVVDSILSKLRSKKATNGDYIAWFLFLQEKGIVNDKSWIRFVLDETNKSEPAKERYQYELLRRKTICMSLVQEQLVLEINKELEAIENDNPKFTEIEYWAKVLFFESTFTSDDNISKLDDLLNK